MRILKDINFIIITLLIAIFLPLIADSVFNEGKKSVRVYYSETLDKFLLQGYDEVKKEPFFKIGLDNNISLDEFMENLPFKFYSYLLSKNIFPNQFKEWANAEKIRANSQNLNIKPDMFNQKQIPLFTVFESRPKYLKLKFNEFGIRNAKNGLEFINFDTLKLDQNMSIKFNQALSGAGFKFPFKQVYSNPNTKKPFDEGVFLIDDKDEIYHLKMVESKAIAAPTGIKNDSVSFMLITENERKEFYGALVDKDGVKLISYDNYRLIDLVSDDYRPQSSKFQLAITPLSKVVTIENDAGVKAFKLDDNYRVTDRFEYVFDSCGQYESIKSMLFAFEIKKEDGYAYKFGFFEFSSKALFINIICFIFIAFRFRKDRALLRSFVVLLTGIYGFIAAFLA